MLKDIFWNLGWPEKGISINGEKLSNLRLADDTTLISQDGLELQEMIDKFCKESERVGQHINASKTILLSCQRVP